MLSSDIDKISKIISGKNAIKIYIVRDNGSIINDNKLLESDKKYSLIIEPIDGFVKPL